MKTKLFLLFITITSISYGQFWTEKSSGFAATSRGINQFFIVDSNVIWATAYDGSSTSANVTEFTKSLDGGNTWTDSNLDLGTSNAGLTISNICALDANTAWVTAFGSTIFNRGGVFKTTDGGVTWTKQVTASFSNNISFPNIVYFWNANDGFCQGDPIDGYYELYTTNDGGTNWTRVPSANIPTPLGGEYGYVRQIEVINNRIWWTTNKGRIMRSDDKGLNWSVYQSPIFDFGGASANGNISFFDENNGLLLNNFKRVWSTSNGGETWTEITTTGTVFNGDISCIPNSTTAITVSGATSASGSSYSLNGGVSWTEIDNGIQHIGVEFKHGIGLTGGFTTSATTGGLSKYTGTELPLSTKDQNITTFKAYPNPVKDIFTIEGIGHISNVSLFNALGQNIMNFTPNTNTTTLDLSTISSGTYFVKVTINDATETMKIVK